MESFTTQFDIALASLQLWDLKCVCVIHALCKQQLLITVRTGGFFLNSTWALTPRAKQEWLEWRIATHTFSWHFQEIWSEIWVFLFWHAPYHHETTMRGPTNSFWFAAARRTLGRATQIRREISAVSLVQWRVSCGWFRAEISVGCYLLPWCAR